MKNLSFLNFFIVLLMVTLVRGQWEILNEGKYIQIIEFVNDNVGWIYNENGLQETEDGGETWNQMSVDENIHFFSIDFINESTGWGIAWYQSEVEDSSKEVIIKSTNGGESWIVQKGSHLFNFLNNGIQVVNDSIVFVYTQTQILKTSDGGASWIDITPDSLDYQHIHSKKAYFLNSEMGVIVGYSIEGELHKAVIQKTKNGGETWEEYILSEFNNIGDFQFVNDSTAYFLAIKYDPVESYFCATSDTVKSWAIMTSLSYPRGFISFACPDENSVMALIDDSLHGWAVGNDTTDTGFWPWGRGVILKTPDGGDNWHVQIENLSAPLNAIHFKDGYGWAVGDNGLILKTEDGAAWVDNQTGKTYPNRYTLMQNYPNPFNPITVISWQLAVGSHVELSIYNILGQKIETILNKPMPAGYHEVEFNGQDLASGIYMYRIEVEDPTSRTVEWSDVKKMIYLK